MTVYPTPRVGEEVQLVDGGTGFVERAVSWWGAVRLWDVEIHVNGERRVTQIRGMKLGGPPWREVPS